MNKKKCVSCKKNEIYIKKRNLCKLCYWKLYNKKRKINKLNDKEIFHKNEIEFIKNYFNHNEWIYLPATFRLKDGKRYTPDFYDIKTDTFIEVAGSRQAYNKNKNKYEIFKETYKNLNFIILKVDGTPYKPYKTKKGI